MACSLSRCLWSRPRSQPVGKLLDGSPCEPGCFAASPRTRRVLLALALSSIPGVLTPPSAHAGVLQSPGRGKRQGKGPSVQVIINKHLMAVSSLEVTLSSALCGSGVAAPDLYSNALRSESGFMTVTDIVAHHYCVCFGLPVNSVLPHGTVLSSITSPPSSILSLNAGCAGDCGQRAAPVRRSEPFYGSEPHGKVVRPGCWAGKRRPAPCVCASEDCCECATDFPLLLAEVSSCTPLCKHLLLLL